MSVLENVCKQDGCIQCWAEALLAFPKDESASMTETMIRDDPRIIRVGQPSKAEMAMMVRSSMREGRITALVVLLDDHECGKEVPEDVP